MFTIENIIRSSIRTENDTLNIAIINEDADHYIV